jgi:hypothetical protein
MRNGWEFEAFDASNAPLPLVVAPFVCNMPLMKIAAALAGAAGCVPSQVNAIWTQAPAPTAPLVVWIFVFSTLSSIVKCKAPLPSTPKTKPESALGGLPSFFSQTPPGVRACATPAALPGRPPGSVSDPNNPRYLRLHRAYGFQNSGSALIHESSA